MKIKENIGNIIITTILFFLLMWLISYAVFWIDYCFTTELGDYSRYTLPHKIDKYYSILSAVKALLLTLIMTSIAFVITLIIIKIK